MKLLFLAILLMTSAALGQARLVGILPRANCEETLARTDVFRQELENEPTSTGGIIIGSSQDSAQYAHSSHKLIWNSLRRQGFDTGRLKVYRIDEPNAAKTELWIIPAGAGLPEKARDIWRVGTDYDLSKPFLFGVEDDLGVCPTFVPGDYAELIEANPNVIGKMIVHGERGRLPLDMALPWLQVFVNKYKLPRERLRLVYGARSKTISYVEFWIIPKRR